MTIISHKFKRSLLGIRYNIEMKWDPEKKYIKKAEASQVLEEQMISNDEDEKIIEQFSQDCLVSNEEVVSNKQPHTQEVSEEYQPYDVYVNDKLIIEDFDVLAKLSTDDAGKYIYKTLSKDKNQVSNIIKTMLTLSKENVK